MSASILAALALLAADWDNLKEITRDRGYTVALRDGRCMRGRLVSLDTQRLVLDSSVASRVEVLRIGDDHGASVHNLIFSGRSSWVDAKASGPRGTEYLLIVTRRGEQLKWKRPTFSDDSIAFESKTLAKVDVAKISYVRFKPLTDNEAWLLQESGALLAPKLWFNGLMLGKISVTLYNSAMTEDNSPVSCR